MVSQRVKEISYAIREIAAVANRIAKSGKEIYHLNIGDPVIYDFKMPEYISQALADASFRGKNFYVDSLGAPELRAELSKSLKQSYNINVNAEDFFVTSGVTEAIFFITAALLENKNEILIPGPSYPLYINYA
ncbi:MAG: aminotransferase class I/II-fold pyridoxal phosphate-dependent enzyme, partial [Candidatus Lokiarchaeota archaeon]|nr:aminotransferase class I/II-fold pyridoxal phosphate-dependent enzyme [Candidatus Lokiarchaeota archaeon]